MLQSMSDDQLNAFQVIEELENSMIRVYNIIQEGSHLGDDEDPLTTIMVKGYKDIQP